MTESDPSGIHDWHSAGYVRDWIGVNSGGDRSAPIRRIAHLVPFDPDEPVRVLDIGGGWGPVTAVMLETFPHAQVVLHDFSEPMLAEARRRLAQHGASVSYHRADLMAPSWADGLDGQFGAIVSHIAIHNVRFPDRSGPFTTRSSRWLRPVAVSLTWTTLRRAISSDAPPVTPSAWLDATSSTKRPGAGRRSTICPAASRSGRNPQAHGEALREDLERMAYHEPATVANQLNWLREAGFDEVECFWREGRDVLIGALRRSRATSSEVRGPTR